MAQTISDSLLKNDIFRNMETLNRSDNITGPTSGKGSVTQSQFESSERKVKRELEAELRLKQNTMITIKDQYQKAI